MRSAISQGTVNNAVLYRFGDIIKADAIDVVEVLMQGGFHD